jgi:benzoyl-CoA-dihydrodiol lyase
VAALNGTASGGGYELALACDHIMLVDDRSSVVSFPELPLLGVLPGTGGLTRLVDKRGVRRDLADFFATRSEGVGGDRAVEWRLVDEVVARTAWADAVTARATEMAARSDRPPGAKGFALPPLRKYRTEEAITYGHVSAVLDRERAAVEVTIHGPEGPPAEIRDAAFWTLAFTRELDDLILDLRTNEPTLGTWIFRTTGDPDRVLAHDRFLLERCDDEGGPSGRAHQEGDHRTEVAPRWRAHDADGPEARSEPGARSAAPVAGEPARRPAGMSHPVAPVVPRHRDGWLAREIVHYLKRTLKRLDVTSRSIVALIEPGSCFAGSLLELALAADRSYHLAGTFADDPHAPATPATVTVDAMNLGPLPMANNLTRLQTRYFRDGASLAAVCDLAGKPLLAEEAARAGLVTFALDDIDWEEEVRMAVEERRGFSPDALTGLEANCRFPGPETLETKIFGRLTAWQNWIFARPNASGQAGALRRYGTGRRADFDRKRA